MTVQEILAAIPRIRALVVGDICLDRWCEYDPALAEPSRETGLNRFAVVRTVTTAGAGGTVANNLAALGAGRVAVLGAVGEDGHGYELRKALHSAGVDDSLLVTAAGPTFTYTKLLNRLSGEEDVGRIDFLAQPLEVEVEAEIERRLLSEAANFDCVLVSDQAETETPGVVTEAVRQALRMLARRRPSLVIWVDSRMRTELFRGVVVKPNEREAREACVRAGLPADAYADLRVRMQAPALVITHGERGALLLNEQGAQWVRTRPVAQPVDICGAGDSFSAGAALALAAGCSLPTAAMFANLVTSVTIMKKGTGTASPAEVLAAERELAR